ncbi:MAG: histidine phosphatase family protein [Thermoleophilia bacterium]|nr:histidine phosphatase family protein [Thermoleophilia bacterium]
MRVYLCRHAHALPGEPDEFRELSAEGVEQARALGESLSARAAAPVVVLSSPLLRARQTAAELGRAVGVPVRVDDALAPGATADGLAQALEGEQGPVATVGHQPDCSEIAYAVIGRDPGFPVAGMVELELRT